MKHICSICATLQDILVVCEFCNRKFCKTPRCLVEWNDEYIDRDSPLDLHVEFEVECDLCLNDPVRRKEFDVVRAFNENNLVLTDSEMFISSAKDGL